MDASQPEVNLGSDGKLVADASPERAAYLGFEVATEGTVTSAKLRLFVVDPSSDAPSVFATAPQGTAWTEGGITWSSRPSPQGPALADAAAVADETWLEYDVTAHVTGNGAYGFTLISSSGNGVDFASREWGDASLRPQLVLTVETPTEPVSECEGTEEVMVVPVNWDTYITEEAPDTSFLTSERLAADGNPRQLVYLNFEPEPGGRPVLSAHLRLWARDGASGGLQVYTSSIRSNTASITWNDPLTLRSHVLGPVAVVDEVWNEFDVTSAVNSSGEDFGVTFALVSDSGDGAVFTSSEGDGGTRPPELVLTLGRTCNYHGDGTSGRLTEGVQVPFATPSGLEALAATPDGGWVTLTRQGPSRELVLQRFGPDGGITLVQNVGNGDASMRLAVTPLGNILLAGDYSTLALDSYPLPTASTGTRNLVLVKLNPAGALVWFRVFRPTDGTVQVNEVRTDANGSLVVVGDFRGTLDVGGGPLESEATEPRQFAGFVARTRWDGTHLWSHAIPAGTVERTFTRALAVRPDGTVLVGGGLGDGATLGGETSDSPTRTAFLAQYTAGGTLTWVRLLDGTRSIINAATATAEGWAFAFNAAGHFQFAGDDIDIDAQPGWSSGVVLGTIGLDGVDGWVRLFGSPWAYGVPVGLGTGPDGTLLLAGETSNPIDLGGGYLGQYNTPFLASYTADGEHRWSRTFVDPRVGWDEPHPMNRPYFVTLSTGVPLLAAIQIDPLTVDGQEFPVSSTYPLLLLRFSP